MVVEDGICGGRDIGLIDGVGEEFAGGFPDTPMGDVVGGDGEFEARHGVSFVYGWRGGGGSGGWLMGPAQEPFAQVSAAVHPPGQQFTEWLE